MHHKKLITAGNPVSKGVRVLILLHGRGATAADILGLASHLRTRGFALLAPQATNFSWYPKSFLARPEENEPWLSSALMLLDSIVEDIHAAGVPDKDIFFAGFSQGACLTLEYTARHARRWGGIIAFTGGLIGDNIYERNYTGHFEGTPVFIGSSDPDPHVPVDRVRASAKTLRAMGAAVTEKIYPGIGHTVTAQQIAAANELIFPLKG